MCADAVALQIPQVRPLPEGETFSLYPQSLERDHVADSAPPVCESSFTGARRAPSRLVAVRRTDTASLEREVTKGSSLPFSIRIGNAGYLPREGTDIEAPPPYSVVL